MEFLIPPEYDKKTVKDFLYCEIKPSRKLLTVAKNKENGITVNGVRVTVRYMLSCGDVLNFDYADDLGDSEDSKDSREFVAENHDLLKLIDIIYEDDYILAVNKPYNMPSHPSINHYDDTLANAVMAYYNKTGIKSAFRAVNRLDKNTSGIVLIAKDKLTSERLNTMIKRGEIKKTYIAIVAGNLENITGSELIVSPELSELSGSFEYDAESKTGRIIAPIKREQGSIIKRICASDGSYSETEFKVLNSNANEEISIVEVYPKTGRTHQIRLHFQTIGFPLLGDDLYCSDTSTDISLKYKMSRHALHSKSLEFIHPMSGENVELMCEINDDMKNIIETADMAKKDKILKLPMIMMIILTLIGIVSVIIWRVCIASHTAADFFTDTVSFAFRFILTRLTYYIPFSFAEFLLYVSVPFVLYLILKLVYEVGYAEVKPKMKLNVILKWIFKLAAFACAVMFIFVFTLGVCYGKTPVHQAIGFERRLINPEDLAESMEILIDEANRAAEDIKYIYAGTESTKMPYDLSELNTRLNESYKNLLDRHGFLKRIQCKVKPVILSVEMSKMHITGVYSFFTGEANVNIDFPDYNLPFTAAHEMAHLMGVAREDEANFTAFLVCLYSDDNYIRYSGLVNMIEYIRGPMNQADSEKYKKLTGKLSHVIINEMAAFSEFFDQYRNAPISKVASAVNDTYLKAQGQEQGEKSYGLVVDLAVAYLVDMYSVYRVYNADN